MKTIIPKQFTGFAFKRGDNSKESMAISTTCMLNKIPWIIFDNIKEIVNKPVIPVTTISNCGKILGQRIKPEYFPKFTHPFLYRKIWEEQELPPYKVFIKPADRYKRFTGFIHGNKFKNIRGPFICSDIVEFTDEWRYYIINGNIESAEWYQGSNEGSLAPILPFSIPNDICCALDMGIIKDTAQLAVIETHHPFSCGWYGDMTTTSCEKYTRWLAYGWEYMSNLYRKERHGKD